jgi:uncharacterized protein (DUF1330 family)
MAAYIIYQADVHDPEQYAKYIAEAGPAVTAAGGSYLVRGGDIEVLEGEAPVGRTVLIRFPTMEQAVTFFRGPEYSRIRELRVPAANARSYVVNGVPD